MELELEELLKLKLEELELEDLELEELELEGESEGGGEKEQGLLISTHSSSTCKAVSMPSRNDAYAHRSIFFNKRLMISAYNLYFLTATRNQKVQAFSLNT